MKRQRATFVEIFAVVCPRCRRGYTAAEFAALPPTSFVVDEGPWRQCRCGAPLPDDGEHEPWIMPLLAWRKHNPSGSLPPGKQFVQELMSDGTWRRVDEARGLLGLPAWLTSRRARLIVLAGLIIGWALAALVARWMP